MAIGIPTNAFTPSGFVGIGTNAQVIDGLANRAQRNALT